MTAASRENLRDGSFQVFLRIRLSQHREITISVHQTLGAVPRYEGEGNAAVAENIGYGKGFRAGHVDIKNREIDVHFAGKLHRPVDTHGLTDDLVPECVKQVLQIQRKQRFILDDQNPFRCLSGHPFSPAA